MVTSYIQRLKLKEKKKRKLTDTGFCSPVFQGNWNDFLDGIGHWTVRSSRRCLLVNQLSDTKIYPHRDVDKSIIDRFYSFGIYGSYRKSLASDISITSLGYRNFTRDSKKSIFRNSKIRYYYDGFLFGIFTICIVF